jgi:hypothetical protein
LFEIPYPHHGKELSAIGKIYGERKMVQKTQQWDSIDNELARTYFSPVERQVGSYVNPAKVARRGFPVRKTITALTTLLAAGIAFLMAVNVINKLESSSALNRKKSPGRSMPLGYAAPLPTLYDEKVLYDFESDKDGWEIPLWAVDKEEYTQKASDISDDISSRGKKSLRVDSDFSPGKWVASIAEIQRYFDLSEYDAIATDIYLPPDAPERGFRAKLIFTVGEDWKFVEMSRSVKLEPGKWNYILASLKSNSRDWKWTKVDNTFKEDVRKIALRIEYEGKQSYSGPIYIDNIRAGKLDNPLTEEYVTASDK